MKLTIPELSLVLLVGPSGCGKSTFARRHFRPTEIVSSDFYRGVVADDEADQSASPDAFELVHHVVARRLHRRRLTVVDATNLQPEARRPLLDLARRYHFLNCAIVFDLTVDVCHRHNERRPGRIVPPHVVNAHHARLTGLLPALEREGVHRTYLLHTPEEVETARVERVPLWFDRREETGPFDVIGDVHGCLEELLELFVRLGYQVGYQPDGNGEMHAVAVPPPGRKAVFVGDLGDRGPDTPGVYRLVMHMVRAGQALCVQGNHDDKLLRKLRGNNVKLSHGLAETMEQLAREPAGLAVRIRTFLETLTTHYVLDGGRLVVAHAGLREDLHGRVSGKVRSFALFGDTTGQLDEHGLPVRLNWAADYRGRALVVFGHTPVPEPCWQNNSVNIDTGCVFGGQLTALRYPERETVSVAARRVYFTPARPIRLVGEPPSQPAEAEPDSVGG